MASSGPAWIGLHLQSKVYVRQREGGVSTLEAHPGNLSSNPSIVSDTVGAILHSPAVVALVTVRKEQASVTPCAVWSLGLLHLSMAFWRTLQSKEVDVRLTLVELWWRNVLGVPSILEVTVPRVARGVTSKTVRDRNDKAFGMNEPYPVAWEARYQYSQ